jgi:hypothetical protein
MSTNPFDLLGIKKEVVESLQELGKLEDFVKAYVPFIQRYIHPDMRGDGRLSAEVNTAYAEFKKKRPDEFTSLITSMKNGSSPELETLIGELVDEVERLRKVELEHEELKNKYALLLAGNVTEARRTAPTSARSEKPEFSTPPRRTAESGTTTPRTPKPETITISDYAGYVLMPRSSTYARGAEALRKDLDALKSTIHPIFKRGEKPIYRPLTFKENIKARVENYELLIDPKTGRERSEEERLFLITERWLDSCTAIAYKARTTKFKLIPRSEQLIYILPDFSENYINVNYSSLVGVEFDNSKGIYNNSLTKSQVLEHSGWMTAVEEDKELLKTYTNIIFTALKSKYRRDTGMGFYVKNSPDNDQLRALFVIILDSNSNANGNNNLKNGGSFLLVAHR